MKAATNTLWQQAGLAVPRNGVANLVFFQVRGDCLAPGIQDGDVLFATWRPMPICQARLGRDEMAVFLVRDAGTGNMSVLLKRWCGMVGDNVDAEHRGREATVRLAGEGEVHSFPASQVHLLADHVRLAQRGGSCSLSLLAGTVFAGLDLWFPDDVRRTLCVASTHETMAASMRAAPPLNPETAAAYQQGFQDALRAVGVAFGVALPRCSASTQLPAPTSVARTIDAEAGGGNSRVHSLRSPGWGG